jgi:hypothetical protein
MAAAIARGLGHTLVQNPANASSMVEPSGGDEPITGCNLQLLFVLPCLDRLQSVNEGAPCQHRESVREMGKVRERVTCDTHGIASVG